MPRYDHKCVHCKRKVEDIRPMSEAHILPPCPKCKRPMERIYTPPQIGAIHGELIGAYGYGTKEHPHYEIKSGPQKGMTVVPNKNVLFDNAKRKNEKEGTSIEWSS